MRTELNLLINSMGGGGAERQVSYLYKSGLIKNINVLQNDCSYEIDKGDIFPLLGSEFSLSLKGIVTTLVFGPFLFSKRLKENGKVLSFLELSNFINILSKIFKPHEAYVSVRISPNFYDKKRLGFLYLFLMKWLYPYAIKIITNSEQCRLDLLNLLKVDGDQIIVIKNAIDIERILELNKIGETLDKPTMGNDFVTIGRLSYQKNYPAMLRIFSSLLKEIPGSRLFIVGNGEERDSLITLAESLGLRVCENRDESGEVFFLGFQENPYQFISKDSVFLLTSHYEGLPNVLLEAMACGSFIVSSDCKTGPKEILEGTLSNTDNNNFSPIKSNGLLLPVPIDYETEKVWTREIKKVLKNTMLLKEIRNNAQVSSYNYHHDKIIKAWENLIHS